MDSFNAHILSDDAFAGSVVVGTGISATLLLFFQQSFEMMLPYLVIATLLRYSMAGITRMAASSTSAPGTAGMRFRITSQT